LNAHKKVASGAVAVALITVIVVWLLYSEGYRLTALDASKANSYVGKQIDLLGSIDYDWAKVYFFNTPKDDRTVLAIKEGLLWKAPTTVYINHNSDIVQTVGWISVNEPKGQVMAMAVVTSDPSVSYVEIGPSTEKIRKEAKSGVPMLFSWKKVIDFNDLKPTAYSKDGKPLYEYRFPKNTNTVSTADIRWYSVNGAK